MGLDNGFLIDRKTASYEALKAFDDDEWRRKMGYDLEVAYWRKCWNVRAIILGVICVSENDCGVYTLTIKDVEQIYTELKRLNSKMEFTSILLMLKSMPINSHSLLRAKPADLFMTEW